MQLKKGDIVKHYKGNNLIEQNIYEIIAVNPEYTGTNAFPEDPVVVYASMFQKGKNFVREHDDLVEEVELLTDEELAEIKTDDFIKAKLEYIEKKAAEKEEAEKNKSEAIEVKTK